MLSNFETRWRYPVALVLGLLVGLFIGGMLATIYVMLAFRESLDTLDPLQPWFIRYDWADIAARPALLQSALIITGSVTLALVLVGLAASRRTASYSPSSVPRNPMRPLSWPRPPASPMP
jgi:type IV secretion system protein VirD4